MREILDCCTPYCSNTVLIKEEDVINYDYVFCPECRKEHSLCALKVQVDHEKPIKEVILDAKLFKTANGMSDYVGVSFVTMYNWIFKYFNLTFQEFRRTFICNSTKCYTLDIERSSYSRNDYILKKIRNRSKYCACLNALEPNHIMTNCPQEVVSSILRGFPNIRKISDSVFALAPKPAHFYTVCPIIRLNPCVPIQVPTRCNPIHYFERVS